MELIHPISRNQMLSYTMNWHLEKIVALLKQKLTN